MPMKNPDLKKPAVSAADRRELARIERAFRGIDKLTGFKPVRPVDPDVLRRLREGGVR